MRRLRLVSIGFLWVCGLVLAEVPIPLADLSHHSAKVREEAQAKVTDWASRHPGLAKEKLLKIYVTSNDPELRRRLIPALEYAYFPQKGYLGVQMTSGNYDREGRLLPLKERKPGVIITKVVPDTPAARAGLQEGDLILKVNEKELRAVDGDERIDAVAKEIQRHQPATPVVLTIERDGKELEIRQKLGILPVPSERAKMQLTLAKAGKGVVSLEIREQLREFRRWLLRESAKERKNLIAERRS